MMRSDFSCGPCGSTFREALPFRKHLSSHDPTYGKPYGGLGSHSGSWLSGPERSRSRAIHMRPGVNLVDALAYTWEHRFDPHFPGKDTPLGEGIEELPPVKMPDAYELIRQVSKSTPEEIIPAAVQVECQITPAILERMAVVAEPVQVSAPEPEPIEEPSPPVPVEPGRVSRKKHGPDDRFEQLCDRCWTKQTFSARERFCASCRVRGRVMAKCR